MNQAKTESEDTCLFLLSKALTYSAYQTALQRANIGADSLLGPPESAFQGPADDAPQGSDSENAQGPAEDTPQGPGEVVPQGPDVEPGDPSEEAPLKFLL